MADSKFISGRVRQGRVYLRRPIEDRFWEKVQKTDGCWIWTAAKQQYGHGKFADWPTGKHWAAHRFSWFLHHGQIPEGMQVCHRCDNPPCVRPDHLFLGTQADNLADMRAKGRSCIGAKNGMTKLSVEAVKAIHAAVKTGERTTEIARRFNTKPGHVLQIARGHRWKYLGLEPLFVGPRSGNQYKTHCKNGHPFSEANTHTKTGRRGCRTCWRESKRRHQS